MFTAALCVACAEPEQKPAVQQDSVAQTAAPQLPAVDVGAARLAPVDRSNPSFQAFRDTLLAALERRNTTFLYRILAPEIKNSFGGDDSISGFKRMWRMNEPAPSEVWAQLTRVLRLGVVQDSNTVIAPYVFKQWPDSIDAFEHIAVTRANAPVYESADRGSRVLGGATYSILKRVSDDMGWYEVELPDGRKAWLREEDVYSPVDWRAFFEQRGGRWALVMFVAGD